MRTKILSVALAAVATAPLVFNPVAVSAQETASTQDERYSVSDTPVGTLLDDRAAADILKRLIPAVYANDMFQTMGRPNTLKAIQQYEPEALSDANLARIQAEFDKLPAKK